MTEPLVPEEEPGAPFRGVRAGATPAQTSIVYCKDDNWAGDFPTAQFDFPGYTFRSRPAKKQEREVSRDLPLRYGKRASSRSRLRAPEGKSPSTDSTLGHQAEPSTEWRQRVGGLEIDGDRGVGPDENQDAADGDDDQFARVRL